MKKLKIFAGGTCNGSKWRDRLIKLLDTERIDFFNPVVKTWDEQARLNEIKAREEADILLYVITPLMTGVYAIAEVVEDSIKNPSKTIFCALDTDTQEVSTIYGVLESVVYFEKFQVKSLGAVAKMVNKNGAQIFSDLKSIADYLNDKSLMLNL